MATVYVDKDGNNSNNGARDTPVLNIATAAALVQSSGENNSEIIIKDSGVYQEGGIGSGNPNVTVTGLTIMAETGSDGLPINSPSMQGSGSGNNQDFAIFCAEGWTIKGITFKDYDIGTSTANGVIRNRNPGGTDAGITVELCTFQHLTGTCINFGNGAFNPQIHKIKSNTFHDIRGASSQQYMIKLSNTNQQRKAQIFNNVFYDWQPRSTSDSFIFCGTTNDQLPLIVISHNVFGTSSVEANGGAIVRPQYSVNAPGAKFEYNIIVDQTTAGSNSSFAQIDSGEANYNIFNNVAGTSAHSPFGRAAAPTGAVNNQEIDPKFKGPLLIGDNANYRLVGTESPAFDAAIGSTDVTNDRTGGSRAVLDRTALNTGIFDIGAFELTGLFSAESPDELAQIGSDFTINRIPNADNQNQRALQEGNSGKIGQNVDQVPFSTALNGAVPTLIRKRPTAYKQDNGKKGN